MTGVTPKDLPQPSSLLKVRVFHRGRVSADLTDPLLVLCDGTRDGTRLGLKTAVLRVGSEMRGLQRRAHVIGVLPVVIGEVHEPVTLEGTVDRGMGLVGREELVVCAQTIAGCIGVGKHASLEHCFQG